MLKQNALFLFLLIVSSVCPKKMNMQLSFCMEGSKRFLFEFMINLVENACGRKIA